MVYWLTIQVSAKTTTNRIHTNNRTPFCKYRENLTKDTLYLACNINVRGVLYYEFTVTVNTFRKDVVPHDSTPVTYVLFSKVAFNNRNMQVITLPRKVIMYLWIKFEICPEYFRNIAMWLICMESVVRSDFDLKLNVVAGVIVLIMVL